MLDLLGIYREFERGKQSVRQNRLADMDEAMRARTFQREEQQFSDAQKKKFATDFAQEAYATGDDPAAYQALIQRWESQGHKFDDWERDPANRTTMINRVVDVGDRMGLDLRREEAKREQANSDRNYALQVQNVKGDEAYRRDQIAIERDKLKAKDAPSGYRYSAASDSLEAIPGGPADPNRPGGDASADFKDITSIRKEIGDLPSYKDLSASLPVYNTMVKAADSKAGDLNLVYGLAKLFDPCLVVREGEQVLVNQTASLPDWLVGQINSLNGGARLQPDTRKALMAEARNRVDAYKGAYEANLGPYRQLAKRYSINEADIIPQMVGIEEAPTEQPGQRRTRGGIEWSPQ